MNAYEIRHAIFTEASETLHHHWQNKWEVECMTADREGRAPKLIDPPTLDQIADYANRVYQFVGKKES